jgi:hypothetical protein
MEKIKQLRGISNQSGAEQADFNLVNSDINVQLVAILRPAESAR